VIFFSVLNTLSVRCVLSRYLAMIVWAGSIIIIRRV